MPIPIHIPAGSEVYDNRTGLFHSIDKDITLVMEHSLVSIHKWEQKYHKPFLSRHTVMSREERYYYLECMTISKAVNPMVYKMIPASELARLKAYIDDPMTATTITSRDSRSDTEIKTAEVLYSDMFMLNIPYECRKWHLNSLIMLIRVCAEKQKPPKMKSKGTILRENRELNRLRRKTLGTKG